MAQLSDHGKGFLLTFLGVMVLTPDTLLIRLIDADQWSVVFWRGLLQGLTLLLALALIYRQRSFEIVKATGKAGLYVAAAYVVSNLAFVLSVSNTHVANTLIILATSPMFAALLSIFFLKEKVTLATWLAIASSFVGILIVVGDSFGTANALGDMIALVAAIALASAFTLIRRSPKVDMVPALALAGLVVAALSYPLTAPFVYSDQQILWIALMGIIVLPVSFGLMTIGPRYIPAPEVSLLLLLETTLGPIWVWLAIGEEPTDNAIIGGVIVVATLLVHSLRRLLLGRRRKNALA